jgi:uncharacterized LabA/DUF88 family protein
MEDKKLHRLRHIEKGISIKIASHIHRLVYNNQIKRQSGSVSKIVVQWRIKNLHRLRHIEKGISIKIASHIHRLVYNNIFLQAPC